MSTKAVAVPFTSENMECPLCRGTGEFSRAEILERLGVRDFARVAQLSAEEALARVWAHNGFLPSPLAGFLHWFAFHAVLLGLNSTWLGRGGETYTISPAGSGLVLIQDKPATIFTIAKTGAVLFIGQICSKETTALTVEPSCISDFRFRGALRRSTSLAKTLQNCKETLDLDEFQGHTITPLGVANAFQALAGAQITRKSGNASPATLTTPA